MKQSGTAALAILARALSRSPCAAELIIEAAIKGLVEIRYQKAIRDRVAVNFYISKIDIEFAVHEARINVRVQDSALSSRPPFLDYNR